MTRTHNAPIKLHYSPGRPPEPAPTHRSLLKYDGIEYVVEAFKGQPPHAVKGRIIQRHLKGEARQGKRVSYIDTNGGLNKEYVRVDPVEPRFEEAILDIFNR